MQLKQIMSSPVVTIRDGETLFAATSLMLDKGIGSLPVMSEQGHLLGMITKSDFVAREKSFPFSRDRAPQLLGHWLKADAEAIYEMAKNEPVTTVMHKNPIYMAEDDLVKTFLEKIISNDITHAPILRDGELVGIVAQMDLLKIMTGAVRS